MLLTVLSDFPQPRARARAQLSFPRAACAAPVLASAAPPAQERSSRAGGSAAACSLESKTAPGSPRLWLLFACLPTEINAVYSLGTCRLTADSF